VHDAVGSVQLIIIIGGKKKERKKKEKKQGHMFDIFLRSMPPLFSTTKSTCGISGVRCRINGDLGGLFLFFFLEKKWSVSV